ncbi:MAG: L-2-amino-thiazoline-4-carboxylic acid hydrolase [Lachnospiraceae bacterium]|nr:L-2-amino-thiazoline-4-carboxylic acid hydrolase [Lachnospiraceae bacterium]
MKYAGMPMGMWFLFSGSFRKQLEEELGYGRGEARRITQNAKIRYRKLIAKLPEFEKKDRFMMNIVNCAMLSAFLLSMPERPSVSQATEYYKKSMMTRPMKWFCRMSGKKKFTEKDVQGMQETAAFRAADRNPYSWNMEYYPYQDGSGYEARFTKCGICVLMKELGLAELIPAMCRLDYTMSEAGGASDFVREYTLASGGPYCDCGYKRKA